MKTNKVTSILMVLIVLLACSTPVYGTSSNNTQTNKSDTNQNPTINSYDDLAKLGMSQKSIDSIQNQHVMPDDMDPQCFSLFSIEGYKFNDANGNGIRDPGEPGIAGVMIELLDSHNTVIETVKTNKNGFYGFIFPRSGNYTLLEKVPTGFINTTPSIVQVHLTPKNLPVTVNFGNAQPASIVGLKYNDLNKNGSYDAGEPGLPGWTINLKNASGLVRTNVTDAAGRFSFTGLKPGQYTVSEVPKPGYMNTSPSSVTVTLLSGQTVNITSKYGAFGNIQLGTIQGLKYLDSNKNGKYDPGEMPLIGWTINLSNSSGLVGSAVTGSNGAFQFTNLVPGQYTLSEVMQPGYVNTSAKTLTLTLAPGQVLNVTSTYGAFGNIQLASIYGIKYLDANQNGIYDNGDSPLAGWTINLSNTSGTIGSVLTTANGAFQFTGLVPGQYTISEVMQPGYVNVTPTTFTVTLTSGENLNITNSNGAFGNIKLATIEGLKYLDPDLNGVFDSNDTPLANWTINLANASGPVGTTITNANGFFQFTSLVPGQYTISEVVQPGYLNTSAKTLNVTLSSGQVLNVTNTFGAFGNVQLATIEGLKYLDPDLNGVFDSNDTPLANWTIDLANSSGPVGSTVTDNNGFFQFTSLVPGQYTLSEVVQPGYLNTSAKTLNVTLSSGQVLNVTNTFGAFGNVQLATIEGLKYLDPDLNGVFDSNDTPLANWTIDLANSSGPVGSTVTDNNGFFQFTSLVPGQYTLSEVVQPGYLNTSAKTLNVTLTSGQVLNVTNSFGAFGNVQLASIQGLKYLDPDLNGVFDSNDTPLANWTVNLANSSGPVGSVVTDANGFFQFTSLVPGQYTLSEVVQPGYLNTSAKTLNVTLASGQVLNVTNTFGAFGNVQLATIEGLKYLDPDLNGVFDGNDTPLANWTIDLANSSGPVGSVATDSNGFFQFTNLVPGQYTLSEVVQPGYLNTSAKTLNVTLTSGQILNVTNTFGAFGNVQLASIQGIKYLDPDLNGVFDNNDTPLANWTIDLANSSGPIGSVVTDSNGFFQFTNLVPGNYTIGEVVQPGYLNTSAETLNVTLASGQVLNVTNSFGAFGNVQLASIQGLKYLDPDLNGVFDNNDTPLANWTINLANASGQVGSVVTDSNGFFQFTNLVPGQYTLNEVVQPGYLNTSAKTLNVTLASGQVLNVTNTFGAFGNVQLATIEGLKYLDPDLNGVFDNNDTPLANWTIDLANSSGLVGSTVTDANGFFQFTGLVPGQYTLSEVVQPGYLNTSAQTLNVTLSSGQVLNVTNTFGAFGNVQLASIQGLKYLDPDLNGLFDSNDTPLANWTINLANSSGQVGSVVTDSNGFFQFTSLVPGQYTLSEVVQPGYLNTSAKTLNVTLSSGQVLNVTNTFGAFGNVQLASIQGLKYLDPDLNGLFDSNDTPLANWTINLANSSGPVGSTVTDANGFFQFTNLVPGQYTISEVVQPGYLNTSANTLNITLTSGENLNITTEFNAFGNVKLATIEGIKYLDPDLNGVFDGNDTPLANWTINLANSSGLVGSVATDANGFFQFTNLVPGQYTISEVVQPGYLNTSAKTLNVTLTSGQVLNVTNSFGAFGNVQFATIEGLKYLDPDLNGMFDSNDTPLANWTIDLANSSGPVGSTVTNANGFFQFTNLVPGQYTISEVVQPGYVNTSAKTLNLTLHSGEILNVTNSFGAFGNVLLGAIGGIKYMDANMNGSYDPNAVFATTWGSYGTGNGDFSQPFGVAVSPTSFVYVTDLFNDNVQVFDANGNFITKFGRSGSGNGQFQNPTGIAVNSSGFVYVSDGGNNRVEVFDANGNYLTQFGSSGSGNGQFDGPNGLSFNSTGFIYVADNGNNRIEVFDPNFNFVTAFGTAGSGNGQFNGINDAAVNSTGFVYASDQGNNRVEVFDANGNYLTQFAAPIGPIGIAFDSRDNVYVVVGFSASRVLVFDTNGNFLTQIGSFGSGNGQFDGPWGIAINPTGFIYVSDRFNYRVQKFTFDTPLPGWTIDLTNSTGLVGSQVTDSNGSFQFTNLVPGNYTVSEELQLGYTNTSARSVNVTLGSGQTLNVTVNFGVFGNVQLASIYGIKYLDSNLDGMFDNGDTPLANWTINLANSSGLVGTTLTNANGFFQFTNLVPGQYTLSEVVQPGYLNTSAKTLNITLAPGEALNVTNSFGVFGNVKLATVYGITYRDINRDNSFDDGDSPLANWTINLTNSSGLVGSTLTNSSGFFQFSNLLPGNYTVSEVLQTGYKNTSPKTINITLHSGDNINVTSLFGVFGNYPKYAYVTAINNSLTSGAVSVIDTTTNTPILNISVGGYPYFVAFSPDGTRAYVVSQISNSVSVINTGTNSVIATIPVGTSPDSVVVSPDGTRAYVTNAGTYYVGGSVSVINTATNSVVATIPVGYDATGIAVLPDGTKAYVTNGVSDSVSVINTATNSVVATIFAVGFTPNGIAVSPDGTKVYVANYGSSTSLGTVAVINTATNTVTTTIPVSFGLYGIAVSPDGTRAYVTNSVSGSVSVINTGTNSVIATIGVGPQPYGIAVSPDGTIAYVANDNGASVSVINTTTNSVTTTIGVKSGPLGVAFAPQGPITYAANFNSNSVSVINTATNSVIDTIPVGNGPVGVAVSPDETRAYVANQNSNSVSVINTGTNTVVATIGVGSGPQVIAFSPDGTMAYVTNAGSGTVSVINTGTNSVVATIPVGTTPVGVAVSPDGTRAYVSNDVGSGTVSVINTTTNSVIDTIGVGYGPYGVAVSPDGTRAYVTNSGINSVSVINTGTNSVIATIGVGSSPRFVALSPDGTMAYVTNSGSNSVSVINTGTNSVTATIPVGGFPYCVAVSPNGTRAYVANGASNSVSVINTGTNSVITSISVGSDSLGVAVNPDP